jgi:hypothetical protein
MIDPAAHLAKRDLRLEDEWRSGRLRLAGGRHHHHHDHQDRSREHTPSALGDIDVRNRRL